MAMSSDEDRPPQRKKQAWSKERKRQAKLTRPGPSAEQQQAKQRQRQKKKERQRQMKIRNPDMELVWRNLPLSLTLEIYKRLPMREFYQLREVCKDWNQLALERRCITDPIRKPYFVLIHEDDKEQEYGLYLHGMLTFCITSGRFSWTKLHSIPFDNTKVLYKPFSVKGLTFSCSPGDHFPHEHLTHRVFDAHVKKIYTIPEAPEVTAKARALGMAVDTSVVPHTFKVILGSLDIGTQVYDSVTKTWEARASLIPLDAKDCKKPKFKNCLHCGDYVYIWSQLDKILVYSLKEDTWSTLKPPPRQRGDKLWHGMGSWEGRVFTITTSDKNGGQADDDSGTGRIVFTPLVWVWELVDESQQKWEKIDSMPPHFHAWLSPRRIGIFDDVRVSASFCEEYLLVYSWVPEKGRAYRFVLYNLGSKQWEFVEAPACSVSIRPDSEKDTQKWDFGNWDYQPSPWGSMLLGDEDYFGDNLMSGRDLKNCHKWGPYWMGDGRMPARNDSEELRTGLRNHSRGLNFSFFD